LRVEHPDVESLHATIRIGADGGFEVHDEGAAEGLFVEGERVTEPVALNGDEKLRLGDDVLLEEPRSGEGSGLLVTAAVPGTAAAAAGLEGVLLTSLNGAALSGTIANYCRAAEGIPSGSLVDAQAIGKPGTPPQRISIEME